MPHTFHATSEYGRLARVAMRYPSPFTRPLGGPDVHPVLARQQTTSDWAAYDPAIVCQQQDELIALLRSRGTEVHMLAPAPGCSAQHFPRDIGFVIDHVLFTARLNSTHRLPETEALATLTSTELHTCRLTDGTIEGGDVMLDDGIVLVGMSEESSPEGASHLQTMLGGHGIDREVVPIQFAVDGIVHLDDHFNIFAPGIALIHRSVFTADQVRWLRRRFDLIDVTDDEARSVQVNGLALEPGVVVLARGSDRIAGMLAARGIETLTIDYSEVTRVPGSLRCTTLPLHRL